MSGGFTFAFKVKKVSFSPAGALKYFPQIERNAPINTVIIIIIPIEQASDCWLVRLEHGQELRKRTHQWTNRKTKHIRQFRQLDVFIGKNKQTDTEDG